MVTLQEFKKTGTKELKKKLWFKNIHQVPCIDKVIVAIGIWSLATRKSHKDFSEFQENLAKITDKTGLERISKSKLSRILNWENDCLWCYKWHWESPKRMIFFGD